MLESFQMHHTMMTRKPLYIRVIIACMFKSLRNLLIFHKALFIAVKKGKPKSLNQLSTKRCQDNPLRNVHTTFPKLFSNIYTHDGTDDYNDQQSRCFEFFMIYSFKPTNRILQLILIRDITSTKLSTFWIHNLFVWHPLT